MTDDSVSARSSSSSIARPGCWTSGAFTNGSTCSTDDVRYSDVDARQPLPERAARRSRSSIPPACRMTRRPKKTRWRSSTRPRPRSPGRVARLETGMAWAEDPPSRTRHFIANIEVTPGAAADEVEIHCNFIVYKNRSETEQDFYVGARRDSCAGSTAPGRSPSANSPSTRTCCSPRTSASFFERQTPLPYPHRPGRVLSCLLAQ